MDGVGWFGTAIVFTPVLAAVLLLALVVAFAMRREKRRRREDRGDGDRGR